MYRAHEAPAAEMLQSSCGESPVDCPALLNCSLYLPLPFELAARVLLLLKPVQRVRAELVWCALLCVHACL